MSFVTWLGKNTIGVYWNAFGKVDPWSLQEIQEQQARDIARASGVGVGGSTVVAPPDVVQARIAASQREVDSYLRATGQHPDSLNASVSDVLRDYIAPKAALVGGVLVAVWLLREVLVAFITRRR